MLASEIRKEDLTPEEINIIVSSAGMRSITPFLLDVLTKSRNKEITPIKLLKLQGQIAAEVIKCEKQIRVLKKSSDREKRNDEWRSREIYKAHRRILKQVMDGVAFRFLNFQRPVLRQLVEHNQTGFLAQGFIEEISNAEQIVNETNCYVILNDLTNFLRYGDLTIISPEGNFIKEVKTSGGPKSSQNKAIREILSQLNRKEFKIGDQTAKYVEIPGKPTSFLEQVNLIINKSLIDEKGIYSDRVAPYLWVSSISIVGMQSYFKKNGRLPEFPSKPFTNDEISPPFNSLMFFDQFSPNIAPYTVFPFDEEIICGILTGQIQLKVILSIDKLVETFKGKGWDLVFPPKEKYISILDTDDINLIKAAVVNPSNFPTLKKGAFNYRIPRENLLRIEAEFLSAKSIVEESETLMNTNPLRLTRMITTNFVNEHTIWR